MTAAMAETEDPEIPASPLPIVGDPSLGGDRVIIAVDADCPHCGWPERTYDTMTRHFGCIRCTYTSDERNG